MLNKKHSLKSGKSKDPKKRLERKNKTGNQKKENIDEKRLQFNVFDVVPFMKQKQRGKKRKQREKSKEQKENKKKDKKEKNKKRTRERERERERDRERGIKKGGGQKRLRRKKGRHSKINQKCPFLGGKEGFFSI